MICVHCKTELPDNSRFCNQCGADPSDPGSRIQTTQATPAGVSSLYDMLQAELGHRYELGELLGRGGMGAVFLATDTALDRAVAVKVLPPELSSDEKFVGRFEREAKTAAKLDHPGIIPIYAVESSATLYYFVMKYVSGRSLDDVLRAGRVPIDTTQRILWECSVALGHAHQRGVVHRDIKPANIMIDDAGRTVLMDFGISKASQAATQFTATGQVIGTPHYMSPEQAKGLNVDGRSDQYSLAVVGYRMLTGRLPFADDSIHTVIYKHIFEEPQPPDELRPDSPPFLSTALRRALAKDPNDRFSTMEDLATAVWPENPVAGPTGVPRPLTSQSVASTDAATQITPPTGAIEPSPAAPTKKKKRPMVGVLAGVLVIAAGGVGGWWALNSENSPFATVASIDSANVVVTPPPEDTASVLDTAAQVATQPPEDTATQVVSPPGDPVRQPDQAPRRDPVQQPVVQQPTPPPMGFVSIRAVPFGTVSIDGVERGDTPLIDFALSPGRHIIEIRREGYQTWADTVEIVARNRLRRTITLIPIP